MKALLVVDLQNDFLPGGALPAPDGNRIIPVINRIMNRFDLVIASKDWHPDYTTHFERWPVHCVRETEGAEFPQNLDIGRIDNLFLKGTGNMDDGYSAFEATNGDLDIFLRDNHIFQLYLAGLTTEYCVKATALDAVKKGFHTYVVSDATAGVNAKPGDEEKAFDEMVKAGVEIIESNILEE